MPAPDDEDAETLAEEARRMLLENARKSGAVIDEKGRPLKPGERLERVERGDGK